MEDQDLKPNIFQMKPAQHVRIKYHYGAGLDIHNHYVTACVAVKRGNDIMNVATQEFKRSPEGMENMCRFLGKYLLRTVVMEATTQTAYVLGVLESFAGWGGIKPDLRVINAGLLKKYCGDLHEDKRDALMLAELGISGLARGSFIPLDIIRQLRAVTREMLFVERDCTRIKNRIKRILTAWGLPMKNFKLHTTWANDVLQAFLQSKGDFGLAITSILNGTIPVSKTTIGAIKRREAGFKEYASIQLPLPILVTLKSYMLELSFNAGIQERVGTEIVAMLSKEPLLERLVKKLATIPGLTEFSSAQIIAEVGNIDRFHDVKAFLKYVGCAPSQHISGEARYAGRLAQRVNHFSRNVFVTAGKILVENIQQDSDLKEQARKILNAHFNDKKLVYANVAVKIARVVYAILYKGAEYVPFYSSNSQAQANMNAKKTRDQLYDGQIKRKIRNKTKALINCLENLLGDKADPMYHQLSVYFKELHESPREKEDQGKTIT
nr:IS110 family transposase [Candidatus Sigynarchaeota archaeon]